MSQSQEDIVHAEPGSGIDIDQLRSVENSRNDPENGTPFARRLAKSIPPSSALLDRDGELSRPARRRAFIAQIGVQRWA